MSPTTPKNPAFINRCRDLKAHGFCLQEIAHVMGRSLDDVYEAIHNRKRKPRKQQTAADAVEELLLEGYDREIIEANFQGTIA